MEESLLSLIDGLSSENLVTEVLAFILNKNEYAPIQRLFYNYLFGDNKCRSSNDGHFLIETQKKHEEYSTPDLLISGEETIAIIENKFYASFSGGDQLVRYFELLANEKEYKILKNKYLVLLTTKERRDYYVDQACTEFNQLFTGISSEGDLSAKLGEFGVVFKVVIWQEIMRLIESSDLIVDSLINYIKSKYILDVKFLDSEIAILKKPECNTAIEKMFHWIENLRELIHSDAYDTRTNRMSQSINFYGFTVKLKKCTVWFGYFRPLWNEAEFNTPLYMQLREKWIFDEGADKDDFRKLLSSGFYENSEYEYLKAYSLDNLKNIEAFSTKLKNDLAIVNRI